MSVGWEGVHCVRVQMWRHECKGEQVCWNYYRGLRILTVWFCSLSVAATFVPIVKLSPAKVTPTSAKEGN